MIFSIQDTEYISLSRKYYEQARQEAAQYLAVTNFVRYGRFNCLLIDVRLRLEMNYAIFVREVTDDRSEAARVAKDAFQGAIEALDQLSDEEYKLRKH